jgi:hypothetical protein
MDWLIRWGYYPNRSEIIRTGLRDLLRMEAPEQFYQWFPKSRKKELHSAPTTVFMDPDLLLLAQNTIKEQPSKYKNISMVVNRALKWYFKYLTEGARLWEQLLEGEKGFETIKTVQELRK